MRVQKIYLETSVFNFYFADDAPDKRDDTLRLFEEIQQGKYEPFTSSFVIGELQRAPEPKRKAMIDLITQFDIAMLPENSETQRLAALYVAEGIIPQKYSTDALHIAATTVNDLDLIVSYNFQHIVKMKTVMMTEIINLRERYHRIGIYSPTEVIEYD
ncbi:MAG: PIN domain-containing protein [Clostridiales bacterium]|jgi:predicted nucleic acid-binding protein|nr:PIN domain-containing protein [Clostridiales bacterium]